MTSPLATAHQNSETCPRCSSTRVVRNGHRNGYQRFLCRGCNRTYGHNTVPGSNGARLVGKHAAFLALCHTPLPLRVAAQQIGAALSTVFRWRHAYLQGLERDEPSRCSSFNDTVAALFTSVCINDRYRYFPRRQIPEIARFPAISAWDTRAGAITHLVQCQDGQVIDQVCIYNHRRLTRRDFVQIVSQHVAPGTMLVSPFGNGTVRESLDEQPSSMEGNLDTVEWFMGARARKLLSDDKIADDISTARKLAARLRVAFRRWMRAFRGIAVYYVERYVAWFNYCWRHALERHTPELSF